MSCHWYVQETACVILNGECFVIIAAVSYNQPVLRHATLTERKKKKTELFQINIISKFGYKMFLFFIICIELVRNNGGFGLTIENKN